MISKNTPTVLDVEEPARNTCADILDADEVLTEPAKPASAGGDPAAATPSADGQVETQAAAAEPASERDKDRQPTTVDSDDFVRWADEVSSNRDHGPTTTAAPRASGTANLSADAPAAKAAKRRPSPRRPQRGDHPERPQSRRKHIRRGLVAGGLLLVTVTGIAIATNGSSTPATHAPAVSAASLAGAFPTAKPTAHPTGAVRRVHRIRTSKPGHARVTRHSVNHTPPSAPTPSSTFASSGSGSSSSPATASL